MLIINFCRCQLRGVDGVNLSTFFARLAYRGRRGVTMMELLVVIAIIAIIAALAAPNFSVWIQNAQIRNAAEAIQTGLSLARVEAAKRNTYVTFTLDAAYNWKICPATELPDCAAPIQSRVAAEGSNNVVLTVTRVVSSTNATVSTQTLPVWLQFNAYGKVSGMTDAASPPTDDPPSNQILSLPGNSVLFDIAKPTGGTCVNAGGTMRCLRISLSPAGQIRMCDPHLSTANPTSPQAC